MNPLHSAGWEKYSGMFLICPLILANADMYSKYINCL